MKIGIDLGGSHIAIGVVDEKGEIKEKIENQIKEKEKENIKEFLENIITKNVLDFSEKYEIESVGISCPGTIKENTIEKCVNLGLENYNIVKNLEKKINKPVKIKNDAKCALIGEYEFGGIKKYKNIVFLSLGTGIGGAVIFDGKLLEGKEYSGFEFGHMIIEKNGLECNCGKKGCFEKYGSMKAFKNNLRENINSKEYLQSKDLLEIIEKNPNDEKIKSVIEEYIENLSIGITNLINIFEPEAICIGGSYVYFKHILEYKLKCKILNTKLLFNKRKNISIVSAKLKNDAGIIGSTLI